MDSGEYKIMKLGIIGAGNMAEAFICGLLKSKSISKDEIIVSNHNKTKADKLFKEYKVKSAPNKDVIGLSEIILLAVKPNKISEVLTENMNSFHNKIIFSVAAGVSIDTMESCGSRLKIIRAMPNTPVKVCSGVIAYCCGKNITENDTKKIKDIFSGLGLLIEINEDKMNAVSSLTGCSPAYIYQIIEAMSDAGVKMGLSRDIAIELSAYAVMGSGKMVYETGEHPAVLKDKVTSPAGTTIEGLHEIEKGGVRASIINALYKAYEKTLVLLKNK